MVSIGRTANGTFKSVLSASNELKDLPSFLYGFISLGDNKLDIKNSVDLQDYIAQVSALDATQQSAVLSLTKFAKGQKEVIKETIEQVKAGKLLNGVLVETELKTKGLSSSLIDDLLNKSGLKNGDSYSLLQIKDENGIKGAVTTIQEYIDALDNVGKTQELVNAGIIEKTNEGYKLSQSFVKLLTKRSADTTLTWGEKVAQDALNVSLQIGKQALLGLGVAALSFVATKIYEYFKNLKTVTEQYTEALEEAVSKVEESTSAVEELEDQIDSLMETVKATGATKISDIVDPTERKRIQAINDMLEAQLELKKQVNATNKSNANKAASTLFNNKTNESLNPTGTHTETVVYNYFGVSTEVRDIEVPDKVNDVDSLNEHSQKLKELVDERRELIKDLISNGVTDYENDDQYKELADKIESEQGIVTELSTKVTNLSNGYSTDADDFSDVADQYTACTEAIAGAAEALSNSNDEIVITTTNLDVAKEKIQQWIKGTKKAKWEDTNASKALDVLKGSGAETDQDLFELIEYPLTQTNEQREAFSALSQTADLLGVSLEDLIKILTELGEIDVGEVEALQSLDKICEGLEEVQSAYDTMKTAVDEYNAGNGVTLDTLNKLVQLDPKYLKYLTLENGQMSINEEGVKNLADSYYELMKAKLVSNAIDSLKEMDTYAEAAEYLQQAKQETKDWLGMLQSASTGVLVNLGNGKDFAKVNEAHQQLINSVLTYLELISDVQKKDPLGKKKTSTSDSSALDAWSTLSEAMEEYNKNGSICLTTMKSLMGLDAKYTSLLKKQGNELVVDAEAYRKLIQKELAYAAATDEGKDKVAQYNQILKYLDENAKNGVISLNQLENAINGTSASIEKALTKTDDYQSALQTLHELKTLNNANSGGTEGLFNTDGLLDYDTVKKVTELINNYPDISGILIDESGNLKVDQDSLNKAMRKVVQGMINAAKDSGQNGLAQLWQNQVDNIIAGNISWEDFWNGFATGMEDASTKLDEFQSNFSTLKDAVEEFNKYGKVSQDTLQELAQMDSSYSQFLTQDAETGEYKLDAKGFRDAYVEKLKGYAEQFNGTVYGDQLLAMIDAVREPTAEEYEEMAKNTIEYLVAKARYDDKVAKIESMSGLTDEEKQAMIQAAADELQEVYEEAFESVQETGEQVAEKLVNHFDELGKTAENFKTTLSNIKSLLESFLNIFEKINSNESNDLSLWGDAVQDELDDRIEALEKQKEALEENNDAVERAIELSRLQDELARAQSQKTVRIYTSNGYEWQSDASAVRDAQQNLSDKQREWKKEDAEKAIDDQIDKLNELKDKYSEAMEDIGSSWDDYNKKLKYAAQLQGMTFTEMEGQLDSYKDSIVANLKNTSVTSGIQDTISNISTLIETLETLNDVLTFFTSGGTSTDGGGFSGLLKTIGKIFSGELGAEVKTGLNSIKNAVTEWATTGGGKTIYKSITGVFNNIVSGVKNILGNSESSGLSGVVKTALSAVGTVAKTAGSGIVKTVGTISTKVAGALGVGSTAGTAAAATGGTGILATIGKVGGSVLTALGGTSAGTIGLIGSALALGVNSNVQTYKKTKEIWSDDSKSTGSKVLSTVGTVLWNSSPVGMVVNGVKTIGGFVKKIFGIQDKESKKDDTPVENTTTNVSANTNITNITTNGTKTTEETQTSSSSSSTSTSETSSSDSGGEKKQSLWSKITGWKWWPWNWGKKASGDKGIKRRGIYNVDEQGSEILVRQPQSGRYTYLETGDGVVPADITSRLFEMGGNPDKWFSEQMAKHSAANMIQNRTSGGTSYSIGDININNPVGDADALARDIVTRLPSCVDQQINKR